MPSTLSKLFLPLCGLFFFALWPPSAWAQETATESAEVVQESESTQENSEGTQEESEGSQEESDEEPTDEATVEDEGSPKVTAWNLTRSRSRDRRPSFSPDGTQILFATDRDGNWEIYLMELDGLSQRRLTVHPQQDNTPSFSPDGTKIVFQSTRDSKTRANDIYVRDLEGNEHPVRLTEHGADDAFPRFSPDGQKIAFTSTREGNADIFLMNVDGSEKVALTSHEANDAWPVFSPDGQKIAFFSKRDGNDEIYIMDLDGSNQERLTEHDANEFVPVFHPDGEQLILASNRHGAGLTQIYLFDLATKEFNLELKDPGRATEPAISPDGSYIAYVTDRDQNDEIYLLSLTGDSSPPKGQSR